MIYVESKKRKQENIIKDYPGARILDVTSTSPDVKGQMLSPFYPHMNIPIPGDSRGLTAACVEAVWQGLKVFQTQDVDFAMFQNGTMKNLKRTARKYGMPLGHRMGAYGEGLWGYFEARMNIYLPTYKWVLDNVKVVHDFLEELKVEKGDIVLLDYNTNTDCRDTSRPLSHAGLIMRYVQGTYPVYKEGDKPMSEDEVKELKLQEKANRKACSKSAKEMLSKRGVVEEPCLFIINE